MQNFNQKKQSKLLLIISQEPRRERKLNKLLTNSYHLKVLLLRTHFSLIAHAQMKSIMMILSRISLPYSKKDGEKCSLLEDLPDSLLLVKLVGELLAVIAQKTETSSFLLPLMSVSIIQVVLVKFYVKDKTIPPVHVEQPSVLLLPLKKIQRQVTFRMVILITRWIASSIFWLLMLIPSLQKMRKW